MWGSSARWECACNISLSYFNTSNLRACWPTAALHSINPRLLLLHRSAFFSHTVRFASAGTFSPFPIPPQFFIRPEGRKKLCGNGAGGGCFLFSHVSCLADYSTRSIQEVNLLSPTVDERTLRTLGRGTSFARRSRPTPPLFYYGHAIPPPPPSLPPSCGPTGWIRSKQN